jgi:hypothetical protein
MFSFFSRRFFLSPTQQQDPEREPPSPLDCHLYFSSQIKIAKDRITHILLLVAMKTFLIKILHFPVPIPFLPM